MMTDPMPYTNRHPEPGGVSDDVIKSLFLSIAENDWESIVAQYHALHPADFLLFIGLCPHEDRKQLVEQLRDHFSPDLLIFCEHSLLDAIVQLLGPESTARLIAGLDSDDAVFVIDNLNDDLKPTIIEALPPELQKTIEERLLYPEDSVGRVMRRGVVTVMDYWNVAQTMDYLRSHPHLPTEFSEIFVVNSMLQPVGAVHASRLLSQARNCPIKQLLSDDFRIVNVTLSQDEVGFLFTQYELTSMAVVGFNNRMLGAVTLEDVITIIETRAEEDLLRLGGMSESDIYVNVKHTALHRVPWLIINLIISLVACSVITLFQSTIASLLIIASMMPVIAAISGNAGTQALTVAVRAIAARELSSVNALRVIGKEFLVGSLNGILCAIVGAIIIMLWQNNLYLAIVFALSILFSLMLSGVIGSSVPIVLHRLGVDPAISSAVFVIAFTDVLGFVSFLGLATLLIK